VDGLLGGSSVNGSLYILFYEFLCYLGVAVLGVVGLLRHRTCPCWPSPRSPGSSRSPSCSPAAPCTSRAPRWPSRCASGRCSWPAPSPTAWPTGSPSWAGGAIAAAVLALAVTLAVLADGDPGSILSYVVVAPPAVAYLVQLLSSRTELRRIGAQQDLSHALYVYAWPVQILLLVAGASQWPVALYGITSLAIALLMAWASWAWIEAPALRLKSWSPTRT
jgi:hypothetical protein